MSKGLVYTHPSHKLICQEMFAHAAEEAFHGSVKTVDEYKKQIRWNKLNYCLGSSTEADDAIYCGFQEGLRLRDKESRKPMSQEKRDARTRNILRLYLDDGFS